MGFVAGPPLEVSSPLADQPRRVSVGVRRAAVRAPAAQLGPSDWEHIEVVLPDGGERVSSLKLESGGTFRASVQERRSGSEEPANLLSASGCWTASRRGLELIFPEEPMLDLAEHRVAYELRRNCLVATESVLPDGLEQEYSACNAYTGNSLQAISNEVETEEQDGSGPLPDETFGREQDAPVSMPVGIIRDGSTSSLSSAGSISDLHLAAAPGAGEEVRRLPPPVDVWAVDDAPGQGERQAERSLREPAHGSSDEYGDDFEQASDAEGESD
mmetsp:Transcript_73523/g.137376  ORF Transcript_73523/g.137376 Transcript_73523/m.137376 type:complete len:272 (-) Transcript_73523:113-928(-)